MENINFALMFGHLAIYLFVWVFAITSRAAATAWMSNRFGDDTAKNQGRISFSPFVQSDLIGTIIIPVVGFLLGWMGGGIPLIAWGKPVPVDGEKWRNPKLAGVMVSLASVLVNLFIALVSFLLLKSLFVSGVVDVKEFLQIIFRMNEAADVSWFAPIGLILWYGLVLNVALAVLSLIPIPPFNGGEILQAILPQSFKPLFSFLEKFGIVAGILLIYFVVGPYILSPLIINLLYLLGISLQMQ